jgi:hypothetical protein
LIPCGYPRTRILVPPNGSSVNPSFWNTEREVLKTSSSRSDSSIGMLNRICCDGGARPASDACPVEETVRGVLVDHDHTPAPG